MKGIVFDLDLMTSEHSTDKTLSSVVLAQHDMPKTFVSSKMLLSHAVELSVLTPVLDALNSSSFEIVLVSGSSGTGESTIF